MKHPSRSWNCLASTNQKMVKPFFRQVVQSYNQNLVRKKPPTPVSWVNLTHAAKRAGTHQQMQPKLSGTDDGDTTNSSTRGCGRAIVSPGSARYPTSQPPCFAQDHAQARTTASAELFGSHDGFLLTAVAAGQRMIPGTAQRQSAAVDRFEQRVLCQMRCQLNPSMAFLINWNWQKFTPGQCNV